MSAPLKRPSEEDDNFQEETWEESQVLDEGNDSQEGPRQQEVIEAQDMSQVPVTESVISTTGATAPARRPKKQRRGKNSPEPNYSEMVQDQMSTTNRTGQACDRCKVSWFPYFCGINHFSPSPDYHLNAHYIFSLRPLKARRESSDFVLYFSESIVVFFIQGNRAIKSYPIIPDLYFFIRTPRII